MLQAVLFHIGSVIIRLTVTCIYGIIMFAEFSVVVLIYLSLIVHKGKYGQLRIIPLKGVTVLIWKE